MDFLDLNKIINPQVVITLIGVLGTLITSITAYLIANAHKTTEGDLVQEQKYVEVQRETFDLTDVLKKWDEFYWELHQLMKLTCLDRFLILRAWNGDYSPKYTTAVLQIREGNQKPISYVHIELDKDYIKRLNNIRSVGSEYYIVTEMDDSLIKSIYQAEGIIAALWCFINVEDIQGTSKLTYCSFATHKKEGFSKEEITRLKVLSSSLKGI